MTTQLTENITQLPLSQIPVIDISPLRTGISEDAVAAQIRRACCDIGFFYITGHGVETELQDRVEQLSRQFFAQDLETKLKIRMELGGRAWRGYFPVVGELTSGKPDFKEGIYLGSELPANHPAVQAGTLMHGANLFPEIPQFRETILEYLEVMTQLSHTLMRGVSLSW